ncbi:MULTISPECIES: hypothetical protein [Brevibacillus]|uniref:hypothetical protein n=1 Tax=Brevibacillus TaxID=55080 RepID=UPI000BCB3B6B|nr:MULTISPECIES: hypothetical protein [Brevibacillus]AYK08123.1 hypothetical protein D8Z77_18100 [Brevibacillus laterosporus]MCR8965956.1 hypothetical protein [Brevibacillus laterosporus]MCZ0838112.1 hypothetical protein [Brevibacillus halotolerans]PCN46145.1 hypothetical protein B9C88_01085 [Brevibacillus laterosporus]
MAFFIEILDELQLFSQELQRCLVPEALEELAREAGFTNGKVKYQSQKLVTRTVVIFREMRKMKIPLKHAKSSLWLLSGWFIG